MCLRTKCKLASLCVLVCLLIVTTGTILASGNLGRRLLSNGVAGEDVAQLQKIFLDIGFTVQVDGFFGPQTEAIVRQIQECFGIVVDGIVGSQTLKVINDLKENSSIYIVKPGDNLSIIARNFQTSINAIITLNRLESSIIHSGQPLVIPGRMSSNAVQSVMAQPTSNQRSKIQFRWPVVGRISSPYGWRTHPITKERDFHGGIDIAVPKGTAVRAAASGRVVTAGWMGSYGQGIVIDHGDGYSTWYGHNSRLLVKAEDYVAVGEIIAEVGSTGLATGPHLDFRIKIYGETVNPLDYLQ